MDNNNNNNNVKINECFLYVLIFYNYYHKSKHIYKSLHFHM